MPFVTYSGHMSVSSLQSDLISFGFPCTEMTGFPSRGLIRVLRLESQNASSVDPLHRIHRRICSLRHTHKKKKTYQIEHVLIGRSFLGSKTPWQQRRILVGLPGHNLDGLKCSSPQPPRLFPPSLFEQRPSFLGFCPYKTAPPSPTPPSTFLSAAAAARSRVLPVRSPSRARPSPSPSSASKDAVHRRLLLEAEEGDPSGETGSGDREERTGADARVAEEGAGEEA